MSMQIIDYYIMKKVHFEMRNKLCLFIMGFQNLNMYSKGTYLIKVESKVANQKCSISKFTEKQQSFSLEHKDPQQQYSKNFMIKYQNQKVDLSQLFIVQTPLYRYSNQTNILIRLTLFKVESDHNNQGKIEYTRLASCSMAIRFTLNSIFQYCQGIFQQPFLSSLSFLIFNQPIKVVIETKSYKHSNKQEITHLKKEVKRLRYNNYLMQNKFKKVIYNDVQYRFSLPKMFVSGENEMTEVESSEEKFLNYLIHYENIDFTPEIMNYELTSIAQKNQSLHQIFKDSCNNGTMFISKLKMESQEKETKKFKQYITKEEHRLKFCYQYKTIIKQKLKLLQKQSKLINNEETLNNIIIKSERVVEEEISHFLPAYPIVIHEVQRLKEVEIANNDEKQNKSKPRYIFLLAHGYQGCSQDLVYIANGLKRRFKKSKYLILKSFQNKMDQSVAEMGKVAVEEVNSYLSTFKFNQKEYRIVMIGHSMGGLILRCVAASISHPENLYGFITMGTPHLGYLQGIKFFIKAGISLLSNISSSNVCLSELSSKDNNDLHECLIYRLSVDSPLSAFKKIILLSSVHDKYVSWHSARLEDYNKDPLKQLNFIEHEMIDNIIGKQNRIQRIDRIEVDFKSQQNNMDRIIGRSSHIKFLNDHQFIELFINGCLPSILDN